MRTKEMVVRVCGAAGDGNIVAGQVLNRAVARMGFHVLNFDSYPAEIRGFGKSVAHTRFSVDRVWTAGDRCDCLIALHDAHSIPEMARLGPGAIVLYDDRPPDWHEEDRAVAGFVMPGMHGYGVPLRELSTRATKGVKARNFVALGAFAGLVMLPPEPFREAIRERFSGKSEEVREGNVRAFDLGWRHATERLKKRDGFDFGLASPRARVEGAEIISGNEAAARACLDASLRLYAGYPITPATKILEVLAKKLPAAGGVVVQTEDEISAIAHAVGAGFAGVRAATATSGPGLCLMVEALNLAVMAEVPVVVIDSQRGGPSTGLPTKTEQSDFRLAAHGASGDSPRPVLAPTDVRECYALVRKAFELADAFQTPVIVLLDFFLSNRIEDVEGLEEAAARFGSYAEVRAEEGHGAFRRYAVTESGVSPRAVPGMGGLFHAATGLEHDERGFPDYGRDTHMAMTAKRHRKMASLAARWPEPEPVGPPGALDIGVVSWGSTVGATMEAMESLRAMGLSVGGVFPRLLWPVQEGPLNALSARSRVLAVVEMNHDGQYADEVERVLRREVLRVARVGSDPMGAVEIADALARGSGRGGTAPRLAPVASGQQGG